MTKIMDRTMAEKKKVILDNPGKAANELALEIGEPANLVEIIRYIVAKGLDKDEEKRKKIREKGSRYKSRGNSINWEDPKYEKFLKVNREAGRTYGELQEDFLKVFGIPYSKTTMREHCPLSPTYGRAITCGKFEEEKNE